MKRFSYPFLRLFLTSLILLIFQNIHSQNAWDWNLKKIGADYYQTTAGEHHIVTKAKYTFKNLRSAIFNAVPYYNNAALSINQLDPLDYNKFGFSVSTFIKTETLLMPIWVSSAMYAKDFDTDTADNYFILADSRAVQTDSTQIALCKATSTGSILWTKMYGGSSAEYAIAIRRTDDGNFIILAQTQSNDGDIVGYNGGKDILVLKINNIDGNVIWRKTIGTPADEIPTDLEISNDGSFVISGSAESSSLFPSSYTASNSFLLKCDSNATIQWTKIFGGNGMDKISAFATIKEGGFVSISTTTSSNGDYPVNNGGSDVYIFRHNANGDVVWKKHYGFNDNDIAGDIAVSSCEKIYASWSRQFNGGPQPLNLFPAYCQNAAVRIVLQHDGVESYNYEDNFIYPPTNNTGYWYPFNELLNTSIASNNKGGILTADIGHVKHYEYGAGGVVTREFIITEYGIVPLKKNIDTTICKQQQVGNKLIYADTSYADTLRNSCNVDSLINNYTVHVRNADVTIRKDTIVCYGSFYRGTAVYSAFLNNDSTVLPSTCGGQLLITKTFINVTPEIVNNFSKDTVICQASNVLLKAYQAAVSYLWQDNSTNMNYLATKEGIYSVVVTDTFKCKKKDSINIKKNDLFLSLRDTSIQYPQTVLLSPFTNGNIVWSFDPTLSCTLCQSTIATPLDTKTYYVSSSKDNCTIKGTLKVIVIRSFYMYLPNAFSPNNDNLNDLFKAYTNCSGTFLLEIYNRYGGKIFASNNPASGWDGNYGGVKQSAGNYTYLVYFQDDKKRTLTKKGNFLLVR